MEATPVTIDNALQVSRKTLGGEAPIALYRLVRLVAIEEILGRGAASTAYLAGKRLGAALNLPNIEGFLELCNTLKLGRIEVPIKTEHEMRIDVYECVTCSGLTPVGRTLCSFEGGLVAGALQSITGKRAHAKEVTCIGGLGHDACGFRVKLD